MSKRHDPSVQESQTPGLIAFDSLRAEDEPWLEHCFVPPPEFDLIAGSRSVVVFGESGSGKTALYQALQRRLMPASDRPTRLSFDWRPQAGIPPEFELGRLLAAGAEKLLALLACWPSAWSEAPQHARKTLIWFLHKHLAGALHRLVDELGEEGEEESRTLLRKLASSTISNTYLDEASAGQVIAELTKALPRIGLTDVCVLVGPDALSDLVSASASLADFLSTLRLFENPRFVYKLILPAELEPDVSEAGGVVRRRLDRYRLRWLEHDLVTVLEQRLWLATGGQVQQLTDVCEDNELFNWLSRCGDRSPRGWLYQARPLAAHYLNHNRSVTTDEWHQIRRLHPPAFWLEPERRLVVVGYRQIKDISDTEWSILHYLYQHRDRICSRDELYHEAHLPASGTAQTDQRFLPKEYEGALNNALLRLRQAVEPDPSHPMYIVTYRGKGIKLEMHW